LALSLYPTTRMFGSYKAKCLNSIEILEVSIKVSQKFTLPFTPYPPLSMVSAK